MKTSRSTPEAPSAESWDALFASTRSGAARAREVGEVAGLRLSAAQEKVAGALPAAGRAALAVAAMLRRRAMPIPGRAQLERALQNRQPGDAQRWGWIGLLMLKIAAIVLLIPLCYLAWLAAIFFLFSLLSTIFDPLVWLGLVPLVVFWVWRRFGH